MKTKILRIMGLLLGIIGSIIIELFYQGGVVFMSIITILLIGTIVSYFKYPEKIKLFGNMSLAVGILGSFIGLYTAFEFIQQAGNVAPGILAGGLKVAFTATMYGLIVYIFSLGLRLTKV
jgi:hydrogenase-4 membrane subunit HyfE|tara:strand:+ start:726 stop:1085 length:360 start_codon:yes stop_codon:yes gene_type:complete